MDSLNTISIEKYIYLKSIDSTNAFVSDLTTKSNPLSDLCVYTFKQTAGKGQIGRNWFSDVNKNITLSYLVHLRNIDVHHQFYLNIAVSLAIQSFISNIVEQSVTVKWPNDIYINDDKVCGILIQNQLQGKMINKCIIGIGLNVNQDKFPKDLPNPTSLFNHTDQLFSLPKLIHEMTPVISSYLNKLLFRRDQLLSNYLKHLYRLNKRHQYIDLNNNVSFYGIINGISAEGKLLIKVGEDLKAYNFREIKFVI